MVAEQLLAKRTWRDYYNEEELRRGRQNRLKTIIGFPIFVGGYFLLAYVMELLSPQSGNSGHTAAPPWALVLQGIMAVAAIFAFVLQSSLLPSNADEDIYHAQKYIGIWLFLTQHCLTLQAIHLVVSLIAFAGPVPSLVRLTNCISLWIGGLGCFVTVQYFSLVHDNPEFVATCAETVSRDPPYNLRIKCFWLHIFALPLAVLDVMVSRNHEELRCDSSLVVSLLMLFFFTVFYLSIIVANFSATGHWPYNFLKELKTLGAWAGFMIVQSAILCVFCLSLWGLSFLPSSWEVHA